MRLALAALALAVTVVGLLVLPLPLWSGQPQLPPPPGAAASPDSSPAAATAFLQPLPAPAAIFAALALLLGLALPFRPYVLALGAAAETRVSPRALLALTALLALCGLLIYPGYGSDLFDYIGFERMWVVYGDNPLFARPVERPNDWARPFVWYPDRTPAYGPLWAILTWPLVALGGDSTPALILGYKLVTATCYVMCCALIWHIAESGDRRRALLLFAWSPLVLFDVLGKVHNDILLALGALAGVWALQRGRRGVAIAATVAAALVKVVVLPVTLAIGAAVFRQHGRRTLAASLLLPLALAIVLYAPFWQGLDTLAPITQQTSRLVWSPASLLVAASTWLLGAPHESAVRLVLALAWLGASGLLLLRHRLASPADIAALGAWLYLLTVLLLTGAVFAHYLVPALALAAVANHRRLERVVLWLSIGAMATYGLDVLGVVFGPGWPGSAANHALGSLVLLVPAAIVGLSELVQPARSLNSSSPSANPPHKTTLPIT